MRCKRPTNTIGHERLRRFLGQTQLNISELARLADCTPLQISHLLAGRRRASLDLAVRIDKATNGAVDVYSWCQIRSGASRERGIVPRSQRIPRQQARSA